MQASLPGLGRWCRDSDYPASENEGQRVEGASGGQHWLTAGANQKEVLPRGGSGWVG